MIAFDLSLTETGFAYRICNDVQSGVLKPPKGVTGMERLAWIRDRVMELVRAQNHQSVVLEGYSYNSGNQAHQVGELGGVIRLALHEDGRYMANIPPATLKKFATGKGNAKKDEMLSAAIRRLGYDGSNHNETDAIFLLHAGLVDRGEPLVDFPKAQVAALEGKVRWL